MAREMYQISGSHIAESALSSDDPIDAIYRANQVIGNLMTEDRVQISSSELLPYLTRWRSLESNEKIALIGGLTRKYEADARAAGIKYMVDGEVEKTSIIDSGNTNRARIHADVELDAQRRDESSRRYEADTQRRMLESQVSGLVRMNDRREEGATERAIIDQVVQLDAQKRNHQIRNSELNTASSMHSTSEYEATRRVETAEYEATRRNEESEQGLTSRTRILAEIERESRADEQVTARHFATSQRRAHETSEYEQTKRTEILAEAELEARLGEQSTARHIADTELEARLGDQETTRHVSDNQKNLLMYVVENETERARMVAETELKKNQMKYSLRQRAIQDHNQMRRELSKDELEKTRYLSDNELRIRTHEANTYAAMVNSQNETKARVDIRASDNQLEGIIVSSTNRLREQVLRTEIERARIDSELQMLNDVERRKTVMILANQRLEGYKLALDAQVKVRLAEIKAQAVEGRNRAKSEQAAIMALPEVLEQLKDSGYDTAVVEQTRSNDGIITSYRVFKSGDHDG